MAYNKESQKRYSAKTKTYAVKYYPTDIIESIRLQTYLQETGQSANSYIKSVIKADLDRKGINIKHDIDNGI